VLLLRYLDVCLVAATAPFVAIGGLPLFGYAVGACAWILTRAGVAFAQDRARRAGDARLRAGLAVGSMMARVWLIVAAVLVARYAGGKQDGVMAAALVLAAFTVYLVMSFVLRPTRPTASAQGRPSTS
jgi:hypothetical protein